jgi:hypothetical protein
VLKQLFPFELLRPTTQSQSVQVALVLAQAQAVLIQYFQLSPQQVAVMVEAIQAHTKLPLQEVLAVVEHTTTIRVALAQQIRVLMEELRLGEMMLVLVEVVLARLVSA